MDELKYIIGQAKKFYYSGWDDKELRKCVDMLPVLSREELISLYTSRWISGGKVLKEEVFKILYMDRLGEREERIKNLSTNQLINEFEDKTSGNVSLIRQELRYRYKENYGDDRIKIAASFGRSTKGDQQWLELQMRREQNGERK